MNPYAIPFDGTALPFEYYAPGYPNPYSPVENPVDINPYEIIFEDTVLPNVCSPSHSQRRPTSISPMEGLRCDCISCRSKRCSDKSRQTGIKSNSTRSKGHIQRLLRSVEDCNHRGDVNPSNNSPSPNGESSSGFEFC